MKIFLDFDDVLFNTRTFIESMKAVYETCGISKEIWSDAYRAVKVGFAGEERTFDFEAHIIELHKQVSFDEKLLRQKIGALVKNTERFMFPDTKKFLARLQDEKVAIYIVSFGTSDFQTEKIEGANIEEYVEKIIVTSDYKASTLHEYISDNDEGVWFFDDRVKYIENVKQTFPKIRTIFMRREAGRYHDEPTALCDYVAENLDEAAKIIMKLEA